MESNNYPQYPVYPGPDRYPVLNGQVNNMGPAGPRGGYGDDIEVIDLDNARGQVKPTTWHM